MTERPGRIKLVHGEAGAQRALYRELGKDEETEEFGEGRKVILCLLQVNTRSYPRTKKA